MHPTAVPSDAPSATADAPVATPAAGEGEGRDPIDDEELNTSIDDEADATYTGGHVRARARNPSVWSCPNPFSDR